MCARELWLCGAVAESAESVGQNGAFQQQAGESVTRGDRRRRELEARRRRSPACCWNAGAPPAASGDRLWRAD